MSAYCSAKAGVERSAVDEPVAAIGVRKRRVAYPRWFLRLLPLLSSALMDRQAARRAAGPLREFERLAAETGATKVAAAERTRELWGCSVGGNAQG